MCDTVNSGWSIVYKLRGHRLQFLKNIVFLSLKSDFVLTNSADPDEIRPYAAFHLVLHCFTQCKIDSWIYFQYILIPLTILN